jgi:ribose 1,5-bisphosphokinase PhnN
VDDVNSGSPGIFLQGLFMMKSQLTNQDTDNMLISLLSGTVNGESVLGCEEKQTKDSHGNWLGFYALLHPESTQDWLKLVGSILAILAGIGVLCKSVKVAIDAIRKLSNNPPEAEIANLNRQVRNLEEIQAEMEASLPDRMARLKVQIVDVILQDNQEYMRSIALKQRAYLEKIAEYGVNDNLVDVTESLDLLDQKLAETAREDLGNIMDDLMKRIKTNSTILNKEAYAIRNEASAQDQEAMEKSSKAIERTTARLDENERRRQEWEEDEIPEEVEVPEILE